MFYVMINTTSYLTACGDGDPPRSLFLQSAQKFNTEKAAIKRIKTVVISHPQREFLTYHIYSDSKRVKTIETKFGQIFNTPSVSK